MTLNLVPRRPIAMQLACALLCICAVAAPAEERIGPGVSHYDEVLTGPLAYNVLKVDLANPDVRVRAAKDRNRLHAGQKVQELAARVSQPGKAVVAGVNADFWSMVPKPYTPIGAFVADGMIWYLPQASLDRSVFALTRDGRPFIGLISMEVTLKGGGLTLRVPRINDARATEGLVLVTPQMGERMTLNGDFAFVPLKMDRPEFLPNQPVGVIVAGGPTTQASPPEDGTLLLAVGPDQRAGTLDRMKPGARLELSARVPEVQGVITECVGGGPRLVRDGAVAVNDDSEKFGRSFIADRHPRTAVGISKDRRTIYLVTVDGRQPLVSIGQNLPDLAAYMVRIGCWEAMNLDGGGSTTMVVRGEVANSPSDRTGPRTVTNSLLVVSTAPTGPLAQIVVKPMGEPLRLPGAALVELRAAGYDENFNPVPVEKLSPNWRAVEEVGTLTGQGATASLRTAAGPTEGTVAVSAGKIEGAVRVEVLPVEEIATEPRALLLASGETCPLSVSAHAGGRKLALQPGMIGLSASDDALSASVGVAQGMRSGAGVLKVRVGAAETSVPYFVDSYRAVELAAFDTVPKGEVPDGRNFDRKKTTVQLLTKDKRQGTASSRGDLRDDQRRADAHRPADGSEG